MQSVVGPVEGRGTPIRARRARETAIQPSCLAFVSCAQRCAGQQSAWRQMRRVPLSEQLLSDVVSFGVK